MVLTTLTKSYKLLILIIKIKIKIILLNLNNMIIIKSNKFFLLLVNIYIQYKFLPSRQVYYPKKEVNMIFIFYNFCKL